MKNPLHTPSPAIPPDDMHGTSDLFVRNVNRDRHAAFKADCARRGRTMRGIILAILRDVSGGSASKGVIDLGKLSRAYPPSKSTAMREGNPK